MTTQTGLSTTSAFLMQIMHTNLVKCIRKKDFPPDMMQIYSNTASTSTGHDHDHTASKREHQAPSNSPPHFTPVIYVQAQAPVTITRHTRHSKCEHQSRAHKHQARSHNQSQSSAITSHEHTASASTGHDHTVSKREHKAPSNSPPHFTPDLRPGRGANPGVNPA